jgi:hypothetical protein
MNRSFYGLGLAFLLASAAAPGNRVELGAVQTRGSRAAAGLELEGRFRSEDNGAKAEVRLEVFGFDPADFDVMEVVDEGVVERIALLDQPLLFTVTRGSTTLLRMRTAELEFEADPLENPEGLGAGGIRLRGERGTFDRDETGSTRWVGIRDGDLIEVRFAGGQALFRSRWGQPPPEAD